jgi:hypothetical protein
MRLPKLSTAGRSAKSRTLSRNSCASVVSFDSSIVAGTPGG